MMAYAVSRLGLWVRAQPLGDAVEVWVQGGGPGAWEGIGAVPLAPVVEAVGPADLAAVSAGVARHAVALIAAGWGTTPAEVLGWFAPFRGLAWLAPGAHPVVGGDVIPRGATVVVPEDPSAALTVRVAGEAYPLDAADPAVLRALLVDVRPAVEGGRTGEVQA